MLFETATEMYMTDRAKRLRATTLEGYESAIRKHIAPAWTGREVESITHEELQSWVDSIELPGAADVAVALGHTSVEMCRRHYLITSHHAMETLLQFSHSPVDIICMRT